MRKVDAIMILTSAEIVVSILRSMTGESLTTNILVLWLFGRVLAGVVDTVVTFPMTVLGIRIARIFDTFMMVMTLMFAIE